VSAAGHIDDRRRLGDLGPLLVRGGILAGAAGIIASLAVAAFTDHGWQRFCRSWLVAFMFVLSLGLGGLFWTTLQHATRAGWSVVVRRLAEGAASTLRWVWILFIPIAVAMFLSEKSHLFHWAVEADVAGDELLQHKQPFLNKGFWLVRAVAFFAIWAAFARIFCTASVQQDASGDVQLTHRMQWLAPLALLLYAISQTYAAVDWIKSLEPHWFSTMFGVYFFAATTCGFFSLLILMAWLHYQDMGKQLFAFGVVFWAYIAFSQFMLIWYANIPEETTWYIVRTVDPWLRLSVLLLVGHFILPFLFLISKHPKRLPTILAGAAAWMLFMHYIDLYWLIMPRVPEAISTVSTHEEFAALVASGAADSGYGWHVLDLTCLVGLGGLFVAGVSRWLGQCSLVPEHDPRLHESLAFENI
jgi:hypothetical protein